MNVTLYRTTTSGHARSVVWDAISTRNGTLIDVQLILCSGDKQNV